MDKSKKEQEWMLIIQKSLIYLHQKLGSDYEVSKTLKGRLDPELSEEEIDRQKTKYRQSIHKMRTKGAMLPNFAVGHEILELEQEIRKNMEL